MGILLVTLCICLGHGGGAYRCGEVHSVSSAVELRGEAGQEAHARRAGRRPKQRKRIWPRRFIIYEVNYESLIRQELDGSSKAKFFPLN